MAFVARPYQEKGIEKARVSLRKFSWSLLVLATGGGKTFIFSRITLGALKKGKRVVVVAHRRNIISQISLAMARDGIYHRVIADYKTVQKCVKLQRDKLGTDYINGLAPVVVGMVQTVWRKSSLLEECDLFVIDEAHHSTSKMYKSCLEALLEHAKVLGVTATPVRGDGKGLGDIFQDLIEVISMRELIDMGYLCRPILFVPETQFANNNLHTRGGDYTIEDLAADENNKTIYGDAVKKYAQVCPYVPAIVFAININESEAVAQQFRDGGFKFEAIHGKMEQSRQNELIDGLESGLYHGLVTCDLISEGTDIPIVGCVIQLRRTKSLGLWMQWLGRVLRPYPDCELMKRDYMQKLIVDGIHYAFILDHSNNHSRFGYIQNNRTWSLDGTHVDHDIENPIANCPECKMVHSPAPACPYCGFEYEKKREPKEKIESKVEVIECELVEAKFDWGNPETIKKASYKEVMRKARTREQLIEVAAAKGYKMAWVDKMMEVRNGR
jgi:DNA repair protein RadD